MKPILFLLLSAAILTAQTLNVGVANVGTLTKQEPPAPDTSIVWVSTNWLWFGTNLTGATNDLSVTVSNAGTGTLIGSASTASPFSVIGASSYAITGTDTTNLTVRYTRSGAASDTNELALTGGGGANVHLSGVSTNAVGACPDYAAPSASNTTVNSDGYPVGLYASHYYVGQSGWSDASARTICRVGFLMKHGEGDVSGHTYTARIFATADGALSGIALASSTGKSGTNTWNSTWVYWEFPTPYETTGSATYAFTLDHGVVDGSNFTYVQMNTANAGLSGTAETWTSAGALQQGSDYDLGIKIYWQ